MVVPLLSTMLMLGSSLRGSDLIICTFWVVVGCVALFSRICAISVGNLSTHDQIAHNNCTKFWWGWYNLTHNVLVTRNCSRFPAHDPFLAPFRPVFVRGPGTHRTQSPLLDPDLAPQCAFCKQVTSLLTIGSYNNLFLRGILTCKSCKIAAGRSGCILVINDNF